MILLVYRDSGQECQPDATSPKGNPWFDYWSLHLTFVFKGCSLSTAYDPVFRIAYFYITILVSYIILLVSIDAV